MALTGAPASAIPADPAGAGSVGAGGGGGAPKPVQQSDKRKRFDRQLRIWGEHGQAALEDAHVCLLGAGPTVRGARAAARLHVRSGAHAVPQRAEQAGASKRAGLELWR